MAVQRSQTARASRAFPASVTVGIARWRESTTQGRPLTGVLASVAVVTAVTLAIELLMTHVPVLSLGVLSIFAVLPIAIFWASRRR